MCKRVICTLLCIMFVLSGCGKSEENVDTTPFSYQTMQIGYDAQPFFELTFSSFTSTNKGYYYFDESNRYSKDGNGAVYLMFFDKETQQAVPVCSKANCFHKMDDECDAVFSMGNQYEYIGDVFYLWYYNDNLYTVTNVLENDSSVYYIYQISLDGSVKTKYIKLFEGEMQMFNMYYHRGYVYASFATDEDNTSLYRVKLAKDAKPELIYESHEVGASFTEFNVYKTGIAFMNNYFTDYTYENAMNTIEYYNPVTGDTTTLMDEMFFESYKIIDDDIYYSKNGEIYIFDIDSKEERLFYNCDYPVYLSYDGQYLYAEVCSVLLDDYSEHYIYVLSLEGELVDTIHAPTSQDCYFGDKDYLFQMFDMNEELTGKANMAVIKAFDKKQIGTGGYEWIELPIIR